MPKKISFKIVLSTLFLAIIYFGFFAALYFQGWENTPLNGFIRDVIGALMGAGVVVLVTGSVFIFQARINSDDEKRRSVFERKVALYQRIADVLKNTRESDKIHAKDKNQMQFLLLEVILLSGPKTLLAYSNLLNKMFPTGNNVEDPLDGEDKDISLEDRISRFFFVARDDLDVQEKVSNATLRFMEPAVETVKRVTTKRVFSDDYKKQVLSDYFDAPVGEKKLILEQEGLHYAQISSWKKIFAPELNET